MTTGEALIRRVLHCPHCGNRAPQRLIHRQRYLERSWYVDSGKESSDPWSVFVVVCETCGHVLLYENFGNQLDDENFQLAELEYPKDGRLGIAVPQTIREVYTEAARIKEIAPNAFAVQIRRALEALCEDRAAKGRTLADKLKDLAARAEIPPVLAEMSDALRLIGNVGAHGIGESVHQLQASAIDEFFKAVVEYVCVAPAKLAAFKERMKTPKKLGAKDD